MVLSTGTGFINTNWLEKFKPIAGSLKLMEGQVRNVLKSMRQSKGKGTTVKIELLEQFICDDKMLTFQKCIYLNGYT